MKLSVIIPFYKELELIDRAVNSVLVNGSSLEEVEILICNDGPFAEEQIRCHLGPGGNSITRVLLNQHTKGPGGARNTGLNAATGDLVAFLDADDFWFEGKVDAQVSAIEQGATFVATAYQFDTGHTVVLPPSSINIPIDVFLYRGIGTSTVMLTKGLLSNIRFKDIRFAQDIDCWYALACSPIFRYKAIKDCFVEYSTGGSTKNKWVQMKSLYKVLRINKISLRTRLRVMAS